MRLSVRLAPTNLLISARFPLNKLDAHKLKALPSRNKTISPGSAPATRRASGTGLRSGLTEVRVDTTYSLSPCGWCRTVHSFGQPDARPASQTAASTVMVKPMPRRPKSGTLMVLALPTCCWEFTAGKPSRGVAGASARSKQNLSALLRVTNIRPARRIMPATASIFARSSSVGL